MSSPPSSPPVITTHLSDGNNNVNDDNEQTTNNESVVDNVAVSAEDSTFHTIAGVLGNVLEWYDFALFGFFSDIIAEVFFPPLPDGEEDSHANLIKSFVIFGSAFIMRPIGGLVIGYIGDKHGRKKALTRSLFLMAIPTTCMGILPTYQQVGSLSIILLILCRLLQGISVGGQLPASLVYTVERRHKSQWGYYGSLPMVAANCGTLLGNLCGAFLRQVLTDEQLIRFGWRLPFFSGIIIAFVACYLRSYGDDVHTNRNVYDSEHSVVTNPIKVALSYENRYALLSSALTPMLWAGGFYISFVWMAIYMEEIVTPSIPNAFWCNALAMLFGMTFMLPLAGHVSDCIGRRRTMTVAALLLICCGPIAIILIEKSKSFFLSLLSQIVLGIGLSFFGGPLCAWLVESYSPTVRLTSASLGYDLAHATVGGFSPALATALVEHVSLTSPGIIYCIYGGISLFGLYLSYFCGTTGTGAGTDIEQPSEQQQSPPTIELKSSSSNGDGTTNGTSTTKKADPSDKNLPEIS